MIASVARWRFHLVLLLLLGILLLGTKPHHNGDVAEYSLTTIALADHGSPDIRLEDIARGRHLMPGQAWPYGLLEQGMRNNDAQLYAAFTRGRDGDVYAVHFFGYPLLAALPFKALEAAGRAPFRAFHVVNAAAIFVLALALRRFFGSDGRALLGLALFMLCGGVLYANWSSPECLSAAALLAALALYTSGAPLRGALLAGVASLQNPTIVFFFGFAPLLHMLLDHEPGTGLRAAIARALAPARIAALAAGLAIFSLPLLFNLWQFGAPNIIARLFSDRHLIGATRLHSVFFDLSQGMVIGAPALLGALALWGWRGHPAGWRREAAILAACIGFTLALAIPALAIKNWNSAATGMMRYAFWGAMPLLFALLLRVRRAPGVQMAMAYIVPVQALAMAHASSYPYVKFSPLAEMVLRVAPSWYNPEPEIFAERGAHNDDWVYPANVYTLEAGGRTVKTLFNAGYPGIMERVCGRGGALAPATKLVRLDREWRYVDGPLRCLSGGQPQQTFQLPQFRAQGAFKFAEGWSGLESQGGWNGAWTLGKSSRLEVATVAGARPATVLLAGYYLAGTRRTRVAVNGIDLGWHSLDQPQRIALPAQASAAPVLRIDLGHETPRSPGPHDPRLLSLFLTEVTLR